LVEWRRRDHDGLVGWLDGGGGIRMKSRLCAFGSFDFCFYAAVWSAHSSSHVSAVAFMILMLLGLLRVDFTYQHQNHHHYYYHRNSTQLAKEDVYGCMNVLE